MGQLHTSAEFDALSQRTAEIAPILRAEAEESEELRQPPEKLANALMLNNTTWSVHAVGQTAYQWAGTTALRRGDIQRYFRDLHAGTQHVTSGPVVLQHCGRSLAGLAPGGRWVFLDLVSD
jgi:hypothetical protein